MTETSFDIFDVIPRDYGMIPRDVEFYIPLTDNMDI